MLAEFVFHRRFAINLDLVRMLFAGVALVGFLRVVWRPRLLRAVLSVALLAAAAALVVDIVETDPLIPEADFDAITALDTIGDPTDYVLATGSLYAPYLYGWSGRDTVARGLFESDRWTLAQWDQFRAPSDPGARERLLSVYDRLVLLYVGEEQDEIDFPASAGVVQISTRLCRHVPPSVAARDVAAPGLVTPPSAAPSLGSRVADVALGVLAALLALAPGLFVAGCRGRWRRALIESLPLAIGVSLAVLGMTMYALLAVDAGRAAIVFPVLASIGVLIWLADRRGWKMVMPG